MKHALALGLMLMSSTSALAVDINGDSMIQIGAGAGLESSPLNSQANFLLRVEVFGKIIGGDATAVLPLGQIIASVKGEFSISPSGAGGYVPYVNVDFVPYQIGYGHFETKSEYVEFSAALRVLPTQITRDVRIDETATLRITLVGASANLPIWASEEGNAEIYAKLAIDLLGYKYVNHLTQGEGDFNGVSVGALQAEFGAVFGPHEGVARGRVAIGATADLNVWSARGTTGSDIQSDVKAYLQVSADIKEFLRLYVQLGWNQMWDQSAKTSAGDLQLMAGAEFIF
ncbi:MAG: hypothetical protein ACXWP5_01120 [Bdellovibrionota bacterium]